MESAHVRRGLSELPVAAVALLAAFALVLGALSLAVPQRADAATSGTWHGVAYDMDDAGNVTFHGGAMTGDFYDSDPLYRNGVLKYAVSVSADEAVMLPVDSEYMFYECTNLQSIDMTNFSTSQVEDMNRMFSSCSSLMSLDLSSFDTSQVEDMGGMFEECSVLTNIVLGPNFTFCGMRAGRQCSLPEGIWVSSVDGRSYAAGDIPNNVAATYLRALEPDSDEEDTGSSSQAASGDATGSATSTTAVAVVTVNAKKVTASAIARAAKKAGGSIATVKTVTLGKKVKSISKGAFKKLKKCKTLVIKTKKLMKKSVRGALKGSKVKKIKVSLGSKKLNKKYVRKYKKIFAKANSGKKVTVK